MCWLSNLLNVKRLYFRLHWELKPSASGLWHFIPLAQTAPEIGPVFVRRSIREMQPPPSYPPFLFPVRLWWSVRSLKWREVSVLWLETLFNLFRDRKHDVTPRRFAFRIGASTALNCKRYYFPAKMMHSYPFWIWSGALCCLLSLRNFLFTSAWMNFLFDSGDPVCSLDRCCNRFPSISIYM